jgi:hypothetical protein
MTLNECIAAVNELVLALQRQTNQTQFVVSTADKMRGVRSFLKEQKRLMAPIPKSLGDVSDLPAELLQELSVTKTDELEDQIFTVIRACNGEANLDQVLVGLYRKFKTVQTRRFIQNKLYRMSKKDLVYPIPGERAAYSLEPQSGSGEPPPMVQRTKVYDEEMSRAASRGQPATNDLDDEIPF